MSYVKISNIYERKPMKLLKGMRFRDTESPMGIVEIIKVEPNEIMYIYHNNDRQEHHSLIRSRKIFMKWISKKLIIPTNKLP